MIIKPGSIVYKKDDNNYYVDAGDGPGTYHVYDGEVDNFNALQEYILANPGIVQPYVLPDYIEIERVRAIKARLDEIDKVSIRALRSKSVGKDNQADRDRLSQLDSEAETLRAQLPNT